MKRSKLERHLKDHGAWKLREGSRHEIWARGAARSAVPRKRELKTGTARGICKDLGVPPPAGSR